MTAQPSATDTDELDDLLGRLGRVKEEIGHVIVGQEVAVRMMQVALLAGGHCLLEGVPGVAKTLMARSLAASLSMQFSRVQFTPDLMPSDVVGTEVLQHDEDGRRAFEFEPGPVFTNILLADEINRAPPKTQAALLEAMQEQEVTFGGETHALPSPFMVLATQNPVEQSGTYPLPEAELDRFLLMVDVPYPTEEEELEVLRRTTGTGGKAATAVLDAEEVNRIKQFVREVVCDEDVLREASALVRRTRPGAEASESINQYVRWGAGPRAGQGLILGAKALALLDGRFAVTPDDLRQVAPAVLTHRIHLNYRAEAENVSVPDLLQEI